MEHTQAEWTAAKRYRVIAETHISVEMWGTQDRGSIIDVGHPPRRIK
jgi:hypothetical protein